MEETPWDGDLESLPSSSVTSLRSDYSSLSCDATRPLNPDAPDATTSLQNSVDGRAMSAPRSNMPATWSPTDAAFAAAATSSTSAPPHDERSSGGSGGYQHASHDASSRFQHSLLAAHLQGSASFFDVSPPGSPMSAWSHSHSRHASENASPFIESGRGGRRERKRSSTHGSSSRSTSGSQSEEDGPGLVMPSMRLPLTPHGTTHDGSSSGRASRDAGPSLRVLLIGKEEADRQSLVRILSRHDSDPETDLSLSVLSARLSDRSSQRGTFDDLGELLDQIPQTELGACCFYQPTSAGEFDAARLAINLSAPLEQLEALLNPAYPTTSRLAELAGKGLQGEIDACLMLFSSPPTAAEVSLARTISHTGLPLVPVLILPPPPTSRPQKTGALVAAVMQQLTGAGVRWTSAFEPLSSKKASPLYLLPHHLFRATGDDDDDSSGAPSMASSQELPPRSPTMSARSASPTQDGDLKRLKTLVSSASSRERLRLNRTIAFLEWREVEIAARGDMPSALTREWQESGTPEVERKEQLLLDFSRRVAERRSALATRLAGSQHARCGGLDARLNLDHANASIDNLTESLVNDPTTPRCAQSSLPGFDSGDEFPFGQEGESDSMLRSFASSTRLEPSTVHSLAPTVQHDAVADPFHLPSLLHLVGLNLRLSLLPIPVSTSTNYGKGEVAAAALKAAVFSALFIAGYLCGGKGGFVREFLGFKL